MSKTNQDKDPAAVSLGRRGGRAGTGEAKRRSAEHYQATGRHMGRTRFAKLTPEQRREVARHAARARWARRAETAGTRPLPPPP